MERSFSLLKYVHGKSFSYLIFNPALGSTLRLDGEKGVSVYFLYLSGNIPKVVFLWDLCESTQTTNTQRIYSGDWMFFSTFVKARTSYK